MKLPRLTAILKHDAPGEVRAVAIDEEGKAWRSFLQRWNGADEPARLGQVFKAHLRAAAEQQGGAFAELETGQEVFLANRDKPDQLNLGAAFLAQIVTEARHGKLARVKPVETLLDKFDAFAKWQQSIPGGQSLPVHDAPDRVSLAFEEALATSVTLSGGGLLHIEQTRALAAFDIDSAGRQSKGSAGARALAINLDAAKAAAQQIALRDLGGAVVIDCVGPLNTASSKRIRLQLEGCFQAVSTRQIKVLAPSSLGLMEAALARGTCPLSDRLLTAEGTTTPATALIEALALAEREARHDRSRLFKLNLPKAVHDAYLSRRAACDEILANRLSGRIQIGVTEKAETELVRL